MKSITLLIIGLVSIAQSNAMQIDLSGQWRLKSDKDDKGLEQKWFASDLKDAGTIHLPGSLQEQGFGDKPSAKTEWTTRIGKELLSDPRFQNYIQAEDFKSPFWLTPQRHYVGPAWYQRIVSIPKDWTGDHITLFLERPHWKTTVWVDEQEIGSADSLGTPHEYDLMGVMTPGEHRLTIRVDNRVIIPVGDDAHSVSDQTQTNWNGIVGQILLTAGEESGWIFDDVQIYPDVKTKIIKVCVDFKKPLGNLYGKLFVHAETAGEILAEKKITVNLKGDKNRVEFKYDMGKNVRLWDEFSPNLYTLKLRFKEGPRKGRPFKGQYQTTFGMRQLGVNGTQFTINSRNIFLRGTLECCIFPKTGYPPTDVESWKKILRVCKAHGLNHIRFHSWCPPEAAFAAADEMGFYYQIEASCWATFGNGTAVDQWIYQECDRMLKAYGNHPSFILMAPSNEPGGKKRDPFLADLVKYLIQKDPRRRYTAGAGWPRLEENQYHITSAVRLQNYRHLRLTDTPQTAVDYREFVKQYSVPIISHEIGQWCVYPNPTERFKYTGSLAGGNIEIARDILEKAGMGSLGQDFVMASGKFQALLYKQEIESALRTPGFGGFQLLDLHDFPGQGMAPVGVLDCFWESKGYITAEQYSRFCGPTVPLARMEKMVFTNDQTFEAIIDVAHYGPTDITVSPVCYVRDDTGRVLKTIAMEKKAVPTGGLTNLGTITLPLAEFQKAQKLNLEIALDNLNIANDWNFWVYPAVLPANDAKSIHITETMDEKTAEILNTGGKVLLMPQAYRLKAETFGTFKPVFWNLITFPNRREHTLGILCDTKQPALADFPTDYYSNWQWQDLLARSNPIILDDIDGSIEPMVRVIDDWNRCRKLAILFEVALGKGKLLICSIDLNSDLENRPVARQLRYSLLNYMQSDAFKPQKAVSIDAIRNLFKAPGAVQKLKAKVISVDSEESGNEGAKAIDNDPMTFWHTAWISSHKPYSHEIVIELEKTVSLKGITYLPRQDGESNGWVAKYEIYVAEENGKWEQPAAKGKLDKVDMPQKVVFEIPARGRFIRFVATSGFGEDPFCSIAELDLLTEEK